jgi:two-component system KDP operon response regulator KdpE
MRILVIEDEPHTQTFLRTALSASGHAVLQASTGQEAIRFASESAPDIVLLDLGLPDMDGKEVISQVRARLAVPIIVLSARDSEAEKIMTLDLGANDYLEKPFVIGELMARIRAVLRNVSPDRIIEAAEITIDTQKRLVMKSGTAVELTRKEYEVLVALARHAGQPRSHEELLKVAWGADNLEGLGHLRVVIRQLRLKLEDDPSEPQIILTTPGIGYILSGTQR